jgi:hypothetical protein
LEATLLLGRFLIVEGRIIVVVGHVIHKFRIGIMPFGFFLAFSTFVAAPNLPTTRGLLPHIVESNDLIMWDGTDVFGHIAQLRSVLGNALFEQLHFLGAQMRFL